nr:hypothetical protein CFP56_32157 [Quercus suber]
MRHTGLDVQDGSETSQLSYHFALDQLARVSLPLSLKRADPADIPHRGLHILDVELIFQRHRQAVQQTHRSAMVLEISIRGFGVSDRRVEENLMQAVQQLMGNRRPVAKGLRHGDGGPAPRSDPANNLHGRSLGDLDFGRAQVLVNVGTGDVALLLDRGDVLQPPFRGDEAEDGLGFGFACGSPICHDLLSGYTVTAGRQRRVRNGNQAAHWSRFMKHHDA